MSAYINKPKSGSEDTSCSVDNHRIGPNGRELASMLDDLSVLLSQQNLVSTTVLQPLEMRGDNPAGNIFLRDNRHGRHLRRDYLEGDSIREPIWRQLLPETTAHRKYPRRYPPPRLGVLTLTDPRGG